MIGDWPVLGCSISLFICFKILSHGQLEHSFAIIFVFLMTVGLVHSLALVASSIFLFGNLFKG